MCQLIFQYRECFFLCSSPNKRHILLCKLIERCSNGAEISHKTPARPRKLLTCVTVLGCGQLSIASILALSTSIPCGVTTYPRKDTRSVQKVHFPRLPNKHASRREIKTTRKCSKCFSKDLLYINISSK